MLFMVDEYKVLLNVQPSSKPLMPADKSVV